MPAAQVRRRTAGNQRHFGTNIRLSEMTPESIFRFQQKRLSEGAGKATINRDVATLSALMSRATKMRFISTCMRFEDCIWHTSRMADEALS